MQCPACQSRNRDGRKFCSECGNPLGPVCSACGLRNDPGDHYCGDCGQPLLQPTSGGHAPAERDRGARRQLTVLFCDLVGSTSLSERLDPEEMRDVLRDYQAIAEEVISRFGGRIGHYMGDGLLVYFGYPRAYGDDARRAVQTGLALTAAVRALDERLSREQGISVAVRVGIHTGVAVIATMGRGDARLGIDVVGDTPNIAARLQTLAEPGQLLVSAATHRIVKQFFSSEELGPQQLRGLTQPIVVHRVLAEADALGAEAAAGARGLGALVGRSDEIRLLADRWREARDGGAPRVLIRGEAGIGKSRLVQVLKDHASGSGHLRIDLQCSAYRQSSPLHPLIEYVERSLNFQLGDTPATRLKRLENALSTDGLPAAETVPFFAQLLSIPLDGSDGPLDMTADRVRQQTLRGIMEWFDRLRARSPILLIVEDLHWIDPSTLEVITMLIESERLGRVLLVGTYRAEFDPPWPEDESCHTIDLRRLAEDEVRQIVHRITGGRPLPPEVLSRILLRTDGIPLYIEEVVRNVIESGLVRDRDGELILARPIEAMTIPTTLQDSLMARLDRLADAREVAQFGAVLGREFSYEVLRAVALIDEERLMHSLDRLVDADILQVRGEPPKAHYQFRHALIQEAAYGSLLRSTRQRFHEQIARSLERDFPALANAQPELLAHHLTEALVSPDALDAWLRAGERAVERSANFEAIAHLRRGLDQLDLVEHPDERAAAELNLQVTLGAALMAGRGYAAPEVEAAYVRARDLCMATNSRQLFSVLRGLFSVYVARADYARARELAEQMLAAAQAAGHPTMLLGAGIALGQVLFWVGEFQEARAILERVFPLYDFEKFGPRGARAGQDPGVTVQSYLGLTLGALGECDDARRLLDDAVTLGERCEHPFSLAFAHAHAALLRCLLIEPAAAERHARAAIELSEEHAFPMWRGVGAALLGVALAQRRDPLAVHHLADGLARLRSIGALLTFPVYLAGCAIDHANGGRLDAAEEALAVATETLDRTNERMYEAELFRIRADVARRRGNPARAETFLTKALESAREQGAGEFEVHAEAALAALREDHEDESRQPSAIG